VYDTSVTGDLVTSGHSVSSDLKTAFQPLISDIFHDKVMKNVTSDKGHEEESDKLRILTYIVSHWVTVTLRVLLLRVTVIIFMKL
jgi:hypothetical protein